MKKVFSHSEYNSDISLYPLLQQYHDSGQYENDIALVIQSAQAYIEKLPTPTGKEAIVLDIDETSLSNWAAIDLYQPYDSDSFKAWVAKGIAPAITPTLELYQSAIKRGFRVFFITGRKTSQASITKTNMKNAGYTQWEQIFFHPDPGQDGNPYLTFPEAGTYKTSVRWSLHNQGYTLVANIGDQVSDLVGGYAQACFQVPNPFYTVV